MSTHHQQFGAFLRQRLPAELDMIIDTIHQTTPNSGRPPSSLRTTIEQLIHALMESLEQDDASDLIALATSIGQQPDQAGLTIAQSTTTMTTLRQHTWKHLLFFMQATSTWPPTAIRHLEDLLHQLDNALITGFVEAFQSAQNDLARQAEQLEVQNRMISELSTPILPVHEGIIVLPLVGALDSRRATQIMENLLQAISSYQSDIVIIDITGVPMVDTSVANYLLQTARAANLVGASIILVGIGAEIAQTMVQLGVDLSRITTLANLQEGLQYAFRQLGYSIT